MKTFLAAIGLLTIVYFIFTLGAVAEKKYSDSQHNALGTYY